MTTKKAKLNLPKKARKANKAAEYIETNAQALEAAVAKDEEDHKKGLNFSGITKQLLDRAIQMVMRNDGNAIPDPIGRAKVQGHHQLLTACKGRLHVAIEAIMIAATPDDLEKQDRRPSRVFSLLSAVMKAAMFLTNGRYRMWLNGKDAPLFAIRDETRPAPYGLEFREDAFVDAELATGIHELQAWFGGLCEVLKWDLNGKPFPLAYEEEATGWVPVYDYEHALDVVEMRAQAAKVRRLEREATARTSAVREALALIASREQAAAA